MIDDTNDKIRRNLVVYSALNIIFFWLGITENEFIKKIFELSGITIADSWKLNATNLIVLVYLILRFRFAEQTEDDFKNIKKYWYRILQKNCDSLVLKELGKVVAKNKLLSIFKIANANKLNEFSKIKLANKSGAIEVNNERTIPSPNNDYWSGEVVMNVSVLYDDGKQVDNKVGDRLAYTIDGYLKLKTNFLSFMRLLAYSKSSTDLFVPIFLSATALLIIISKFNFRNLLLCFSNLLPISLSF